jgi:hypothetical protein
VTSTFQTGKEGGRPALSHAEGDSGGYEEARHAIAKALDRVLRPHLDQRDGITHSIHYSDVNGLSRLENYILGLEIATYLSGYYSIFYEFHILTVSRKRRVALPLVHFNTFATRRPRKRILDFGVSSFQTQSASPI